MLKNNNGVHKQIEFYDKHFIAFVSFTSVYYFHQINFKPSILHDPTKIFRSVHVK